MPAVYSAVSCPWGYSGEQSCLRDLVSDLSEPTVSSRARIPSSALPIPDTGLYVGPVA